MLIVVLLENILQGTAIAHAATLEIAGVAPQIPQKYASATEATRTCHHAQHSTMELSISSSSMRLPVCCQHIFEDISSVVCFESGPSMLQMDECRLVKVFGRMLVR